MPQSLEELNRPVLECARSDFARIAVDQSVGEALASLRESKIGGRVVYFYVVDGDGRLQGVLPTRALLLSPPDTPIRELMIRRVVSVPPTATLLDACDLFIVHRLMALPVVDAAGHIVGVIDVDHYTDTLSDLSDRELSDDVFQLIGVRLAQIHKASLGRVLRFRFPWLLANVAGGLGCAVLAEQFEYVLGKAIALALFIPIVLSLAESVAIQSLTLTLQAHHAGRTGWRRWLKELAAELPVGVLLGLGVGSIVAGIAWAWLGDGRLALSILVSLGAAVTAAALLGLAVPAVLWWQQRDPKVASGPIALALTDLTTLLCYFAAAAWLLG